MPSGGARLRSGRAADPLSIRAGREGGTVVHLPAAGRQGPTPKWPLSRASARESQLWKAEWARPQAVIWERDHLEHQVALYVRCLAVAEEPKAPTDSRRLVKEMMNGLGITLDGLAGRGWVIGEDTEAPRPEAAAPTVSARDRLRLVVGE